MLLKPDMYPMDANTFRRYTGDEPVNDDLERVNCRMAGTTSHRSCGWNHIHNVPSYYGRPEGVFDFIEQDGHNRWLCHFYIKRNLECFRIASQLINIHRMDIKFSVMDYQYGMSTKIAVVIKTDDYNVLSSKYIEMLSDMMSNDILSEQFIPVIRDAISSTILM